MIVMALLQLAQVGSWRLVVGALVLVTGLIAALAALAEAKSEFATLYGDTRLGGTKFAQFGTADLGSAETALMDRALAAEQDRRP